jgi:uncharacterized protein
VAESSKQQHDMDKKHPENPFLIKGYKNADCFCDRETELQQLLNNANNGADTTLISPRRMGKTGLIFRLFEQSFVNKQFTTIYIDIYPTRSLKDFTQLLAEAILKKFPEKSSTGEKFLAFLKSFRPLISFDAITGEPQVQLAYQTSSEKEYTLQALLQFVNNQEEKIILAIDEFQQITEFPEKNMESLLRTYTQHLNNIRFVYCGSKKTMMTDIFSNAKRPFYGSTRFLHLDKIEEEKYSAFIKLQFETFGKQINTEALDFILTWSKRHTFYTQSLCNTVFRFTNTEATLDTVKMACTELLQSGEPVFFQYRNLLTPAQWNFLIAVAKEDEVRQPTSQQFIMQYKIGTPANARRLLNSLINKELILETITKKEKIYQVYDCFFSRWLQAEY